MTEKKKPGPQVKARGVKAAAKAGEQVERVVAKKRGTADVVVDEKRLVGTHSTTVPKVKVSAKEKVPVSAVTRHDVRLFALRDVKSDVDMDEGFESLPFGEPGDPLLWHNAVLDVFRQRKQGDAVLWGVWPAGYSKRLELSAEGVFSFVKQNPGFDVYVANAHPEVEAAYQNFWVQGAVSHPGLLDISRQAFAFLGWDTDVLQRPMPSRFMVTGNAVVGNAAFWKGYLEFSVAILKKLSQAPDELKIRLFKTSADPKGLHHNLPYVTFFMERLLPFYLMVKQPALKICKIESAVLQRNTSLFVHDMKRLKDLALQQGSAELLAIWSSYRQLWFVSTKGKEWLKLHGQLLSLLPPVRH